MGKWVVMITFVFMLVIFPEAGLAENHSAFVTREEMLKVAKELHPPGCTDSRTADYCQLPTAYDLRAEIWDMLETGMNKQQVINKLVDKYGERILAAPNMKGFSITAWFLPGLAMLIGMVTVVYVLRAWVRRTAQIPKNNHSQVTVSPEQEKQVQEELKNWL